MKTWVSREDLYTGNLPAVCVVSGEEADGQVSFRFNSLPDWTWILLLFGVFPFLVATISASMGFIDGQPDRTGLWVKLSRAPELRGGPRGPRARC